MSAQIEETPEEYKNAADTKDGKESSKHPIWNRKAFDPKSGFGTMEGFELDPSQEDFLYKMMTQNLEHARHIENERLAFNSIHSVFVAGILTFIATNDGWSCCKQIWILVMLIGMCGVALLLTRRWNYVFKRHIFYATKCYILLHKSVFPIRGNNDHVDDAEPMPGEECLASLPEAPAYCFHQKKESLSCSLSEIKKSVTGVLFLVFDSLIFFLIIVILIIVIITA